MDSRLNAENRAITKDKAADKPIEIPLDSAAEEQQIINTFVAYLDEIVAFTKEEAYRHPSDILKDITNVIAKAKTAYVALDSPGALKSLESILADAASMSIKVNRKMLKQRISRDYLEIMEAYREVFRGKELVAKQNWQDKSRGDNALRKQWLTTWFTEQIKQAEETITAAEPIDQQIELRRLAKLALFVDERVTVMSQNGQEVVFLDWDRELELVDSAKDKKRSPDPAIEKLIADKRVDSVMVEYFAPELKANFAGKNLPEKLQAHSLTQKILQLLQGHSFSKLFDPEDGKMTKQRVFGYDAIIRDCITHNKDVLVGDIADTYQYMIARDLPFMIELTVLRLGMFGGAVGMFYHTWMQEVLPVIQNAGLAAVTAGMLMLKTALLRYGTQAIEPNTFDKLHFFLEDARRLFLANAIDVTTKTSATQSKTGSTLVIYPPAHNNRIIDNLEKPNPARQLYYKLLYPYLNYSLRRYSHREEDKNDTAKDYSGWSLIEKRPLKISLSA
jgi:hypothetical protein